MGVNTVTLEGRVVGFPKVHTTTTGNKVTSFTVSFRRSYHVHNEEHYETSYFMVEAWGEEATKCESFKRGDYVKVVGRLKQDRWTAQDGQELARVKVMAEYVKLIYQAKDEYTEDTPNDPPDSKEN